MRALWVLGLGSVLGIFLGIGVSLTVPLAMEPSGAAPIDNASTPTVSPAEAFTPRPEIVTTPLAPSSADQSGPVPGGVYLQSPPTRLVIPAIELDSKVVSIETTYDKRGVLIWQTADHAVAYHVGTGLPGTAGNVVLSGHISHPTEGSVFKRLPEVKVGDGIILFTLSDAFLYQVVETKVVLPSETSVMAPTPDETLTLITCVPDGVYSHRLIVVAKRR